MTIQRLSVGRRLLPTVVEEVATLEPDKIIAVFPRDEKMEVWHEMTYREMLIACDTLAWFITDKLGHSETLETIGYLGANDIRYNVFWLAAMKCGYCTLNTSPRNSVNEQTHLINETKCKAFFYSREMQGKVEEILAALDGEFQIIEIPEFDDLTTPSHGSYQPYPFTKTYEELATKPALMFHTSGSTGLPKPIILRHNYIATIDNLSTLPVPERRKQSNWCALNPGEKYFNALPPYHVAGSNFNLMVPVFTGLVVVLQAASQPLSEESYIKVSKSINLAAAWLPPSFLEDISTSPNAYKELCKLKYLFYGGGPLCGPAGERLSKEINLIQMMGATEMSTIPGLVIKNWRCFEWNENYGMVMDRIGETEIHEMIVPKNPRFAKYHAVFCTFPEIDVWRTRDLYVRDSSEPNLWAFVGRTDDVVVLSNGEKFNPISMQGYIQDHPLLKSAIVVGQGRFQVGLLVEPNYELWDDERNAAGLIDEIWPHVEVANSFSAATGRIFKNRIVVAKKDKPFRRAGKGTILRAPTIEDYKAEIDEMYANTHEELAQPLPEDISPTSMARFIRSCMQSVRSQGNGLEDEQDFYAGGMDSLQTVGLVNLLNASLQSGNPSGIKVTAQAIYQNSSIARLAKYLTDILGHAGHHTDGIMSTAERRDQTVQRLVKKYTSDIVAKPFPPMSSEKASQKDLHVILTGTTGSLGVYLLDTLCLRPDVVRVFCLNRAVNGRERTMASVKLRGLSTDLVTSKAEFLRVNLGSARLGLSDAEYTELVQHANLIVHNAWAVNFNYSIQSFEDPHIRGVRGLIDLSLISAKRAHLFFISSVGTIGSWRGELNHDDTAMGIIDGHHGDAKLVPEVLMQHISTAVPQGYAESKHVAEQILGIAATKGVYSTVARVGQIAGPTTKAGCWPDTEWLPSVIKTSKAIGKLPRTLGSMQTGTIDWLPVDVLANVCVELAIGRGGPQAKHRKIIDVFHLVNPATCTWTDLYPAVQQKFREDGTRTELVDYEEWIETVESIAGKSPTPEQLKAMPVLALLEFFQALALSIGTAKPSTANARVHSSVLASAQPINAALMRNWLEQWSY